MSESTTIPEIQSYLFIRLPRELQLIILRHVYEPDPQTYLTYRSTNPGVHYHEPGPIGAVREWLKPIRLVGRLFHDAVTPFIFSSIHLHASELSLQRAENIANSPFAHHVREIVHYEGSFLGASKDRKYFQRILASHRNRRDYPKQYLFPSADQLYDNYAEEVDAGRDQDVFSVDRMTALLQKLPRCITFSSLRHTSEFGDPHTSAYTLRRTGLSYLPLPLVTDLPTQLSFVVSMAQWSPKVLDLFNFRYPMFYALLRLLPNSVSLDSKLEPTHNWAAKLSHLKIGWPLTNDSTILFTYPQGISYKIRSLSSLFQHCHELTHLEFVYPLDGFPDTSLFPENSLPKLTSLTLAGNLMDNSWAWAEETLFNSIKQVGPTLKHLHFENVSLERYINGPHLRGKDGSLLRLLFNLTPLLNLETCTGLETVGDIKSSVRTKQAFVMPGYKPGKSTILQKVQQAVCGQRSWPEDFNMDHLPMNVSASNFHNEQEKAMTMTDEAAFIFSSWDDTVDPWDDHVESDGRVEDDDQELKILNGSFGQCRLDDQRTEHAVSKTAVVPEVVKTGKSKRSRISSFLGLKQGRS